MKRKVITIIIALVVAFAAVIFMQTLIRAILYNPEVEIAAPVSTSTSTQIFSSSTYPSRLEIPALSINAAVQYLGVTAKGNMMAPNNFTDVGWYKYGTLPGQKGSAVIDGHVDNGLGLDGVFKHLNDIKVGDSIYVDTRGGEKLHFVVRKIEDYQYTDVPTDTLFTSNDGRDHLNLVTCEGMWVPAAKTYDHRLVIFADLSST